MRADNSILFICLIVAFFGCQTASKSIDPFQPIQNGMPSKALLRHNDSFDSLNDELWDKTASPSFKEKQLSNLKMADISYENGKLNIRTKTGEFSGGAISSKYKLVGDFDIQVDCSFEMVNNNTNTDQYLYFTVGKLNKGVQDIFDHNFASTNISEFTNKKNKLLSGAINSFVINTGKITWKRSSYVREFNGSLRIVRKGDKIYTFYKMIEDSKWEEIGTFQYVEGKVGVWLGLRNYTSWRSSISAPKALFATFDNFKINGAQEIEEDEI